MTEGPINRFSAEVPVRRPRRRVLTACLNLFVGVLTACLNLVVACFIAFVLTRRREIPLAEPFSDPIAVQRIVEALPPGWRVAKIEEDQLPNGQHLDDDYRMHWHGGEELTLAGPTEIVIQFLNMPEPINAVESLELWIMPSTYPDGAPALAFFAYQIASEIYRDGKVAIYALTSRYNGHGSLDKYVSDVYREQSALAPVRSGLPISWTSYEADIAKALRN
jgi:hypothetical protein